MKRLVYREGLEMLNMGMRERHTIADLFLHVNHSSFWHGLYVQEPPKALLIEYEASPECTVPRKAFVIVQAPPKVSQPTETYRLLPLD